MRARRGSGDQGSGIGDRELGRHRVPLGRLAFASLLVVCLLPAAHGQDAAQVAAGDAMERGLDALEAGRPDEAIALFERYLEQSPHDPIAAYNLACAYSIKKDAATAVTWLSRASDWGYEDVDWMFEDDDLAHVRADQGFWRVVGDMQRRLPASAARREIPSSLEEDPGLDLVAMLRGDLGSGAGIVIGRERNRLYVATANHVVRRGRSEAQTLEVQLKRLSPRWHRATVLPPIADPDLDVAFVAVDDVVEDLGFCRLPLHLGGDSQGMRRGDEVFPVGYPNGILWAMPLAADHVSQALPGQISFESQFIRVGFSGGALLNGSGEIVGMIAADEPPLGRAIPLASVLDSARRAGHPVQLSTPQARAGLPLHDAVRRDDLAALRRLLEDCADPNAGDRDGRTALHEAAERGSAGAVGVLLEAGARPHAWSVMRTAEREQEWGTPLHLASRHGRVEAATALLAGGADVDVKTLRRFDDRPVHTWYTALHVAAAYDQAGIAEALLAAGADPEGLSRGGITPLVVTAEQHSLGVAKVLVQRGAAVNANIAQEKPPLHYAAEAGAVDVLQLLIARGAEVNARANGSNASLHLAAQNGHVGAVEALIKGKADINAPGYQQNTPLHFAAEKGSSSVVKALLAAGADPNRVNERGFTPLWLAADRGDNESIRALAGAGADVGLALHRVLERENLEGARMLVQAGADTSLRNTSGEQPLHVAAEGGLTDAVDLLLEGGAAVAAPIRSESGGSTPLHLAAENGHAEVVARLIAAKAPVDQQDRSGRTALYIAVDEEHEEVVSLLLRAGANPNVEARYNRNEDTPVTLAAHDGPGELLAMLLEGGGDPNRPGGGSSVRPLGLAAAEGSVEKVRLLLRAGAIVSTESRSRSPLHAAAATSNAAGAEAVIAVLIDAGHRVDVTDAGGATPLHEAAEAGNAGAIGVLLSRGAPVNAPDECGATPLWLAVATSRYNEERAFGLAQILVKAGADVNVTNTCTKETLLAAVERNGLARVRQLLVARGARQP